MPLPGGSFVRHPTMDWGPGRVIESQGEKVRVLFEAVGEKTIDARYVRLVLIDAPIKFRPTVEIDLPRVRAACERFHSEMKDNRSTTNDGSLGLHVLHDLEASGSLSKSTCKQLAAWCTTDGVAYQGGVDLAREISRAIYGRVVSREEFE